MMSKKTAFVSGANGNLGKAVVNHFLENHWQVAGCVHKDPEESETADYKTFEADLFKESEAAKAVSEALDHYGQIDTAVLTAGGFAMGNIQNTRSEDLESQYRLNFETAYNLAKPILNRMKKQGSGSLFFIGSEPGMDTRKAKSTVAYSLAKSLLFQLANIINAETETQDIKAYVVVPSTIDTPQNRKAVPKADFSNWEKPADIAAIIGAHAENFDKSMPSTVVVQEELA